MPAEARGLVDTNVLIGLGSVDLDQLPAEIAISAVSVAELAAGIHAARAYGRVVAAVKAAGRSPRARVAGQMNAATAVMAGLSLYATTIADFTHLADVLTVVEVEIR